VKIRRSHVVKAAGVVFAAALAGTLVTTDTSAEPAAGYLPPVGHVFVINLENKGFDETWGAASKAPYLSKTLRDKGNLLTQYYGTAHNSLGNYVAQISGQGPNPETQADCQVYSQFHQVGTAAHGQAVGSGCVYPKSVPTLAGQLTASGRSWKGYMQDMTSPCRHPKINTADDTQKAKVGDQYAARHNPFVYFDSITGSPDCASNDVDLSLLPNDLRQAGTTPNLSYITPNLCDDAHDAPCVDGRPGGLASADKWLQEWVPKITSSPAYQQDGMLIITFDESDGAASDSSACCGEGPGPNAPLPGITGLGGGKTGTLVLSKYAKPNTVSDTPYNHYSLLASIEDLFQLRHLGYADDPKLARFGTDVYNWQN
jgi:phospholipase C